MIEVSDPDGSALNTAVTDAGLERSTRLMTVLVGVSRISGLVRMLVALAVLGTSSALSNVYQSGNTVPTLLFELLAAGALSATLVPEFRRRMAESDTAGASRLASGVLVWGGAGVVVVVGATIALRGQLAQLLLRGMPSGAAQNDAVALLELFLLVFMPQVAAYLANAVAVAFLQARHRFVAMVICPLLNNLVLIATFLIFREMRQGAAPSVDLSSAEVAVLAGGTTLGVVVMCSVPLVDALRNGLRVVRPLPLRSPELRRVVTDGWWAAVFLAASQVVLLVALPLTNAVSGNTLVWTVAWQIFLLPFAVLAVPVITSRFPAMAEAHDEDRGDRFGDTLAGGVRSIAATGALAGALLWATAGHVGALLAVGASSDSAEALAAALRSLAPAIAAFGLVHLLARTAYATGNTRVPALVATMTAAVTVALMYTLSSLMSATRQLVAIGSAVTLGQFVALAALGLVLRSQISARVPPLGLPVARRIASAGVAGLVAWSVSSLAGPSGTAPKAAAVLAASAILGIGAYLAVDQILGGPGARTTAVSLGASERLAA